MEPCNVFCLSPVEISGEHCFTEWIHSWSHSWNSMTRDGQRETGRNERLFQDENIATRCPHSHARWWNWGWYCLKEAFGCLSQSTLVASWLCRHNRSLYGVVDTLRKVALGRISESSSFTFLLGQLPVAKLNKLHLEYRHFIAPLSCGCLLQRGCNWQSSQF